MVAYQGVGDKRTSFWGSRILRAASSSGAKPTTHTIFGVRGVEGDGEQRARPRDRRPLRLDGESVDLPPGAHVAVLANDATVGIEGRLAGLYLRDTTLVFRPGPTSGFVLLFRKPLAEATVAAQVLATGTGAMNINACRVSTFDKYNRAPASSGFSGISGYATGTGRMSDSSNAGRWPPNVVLVHEPGCKNVGTTKIFDRGGTSRNTALGLMNDDGWQPSRGNISRPVGEDGMETVAAWECEPRCPVPLLDGQSGITTSGAMKREVGAYEGTSATQFLRDAPGRPTSMATRAARRASSRSSRTRTRCARGLNGSSGSKSHVCWHVACASSAAGYNSRNHRRSWVAVRARCLAPLGFQSADLSGPTGLG